MDIKGGEFMEEIDKEDLEKSIKQETDKIYRTGLTLGAQTMSYMIIEKINKFNTTQGKKTANDYKRLIKDIGNFCSIAVFKNADGFEKKGD